MTALALLPASVPAASGRSAVHKLALALVWLAVASGAVVFSEPAPVDLLTMGLVVLLPVIGLVSISRSLVGLLALMLIATAAGVLAATNATDLAVAMTHTGVSAYLYVSTFLFAAFVAKRPEAHTRLILNAYVWAATLAALLGIVGYFDLLPGAYESMTRYGRATGLFKDPNVFGPFLVPGLVYLLSRIAGAPLRKSVPILALMLVIGLGLLLTFSRGAWFNMAVAIGIYGMLYILTVRSNRARLRFAVLAAMGLAAMVALVLVALQFDAVSGLASQRASLDQSYDEGPQGRFGGQQKAAGLALDNPLGLGAQQFVPQYHHEEPHNVYITMFLNAGWVGGLAFLALVGMTSIWGLRHAFVRCATQPLFLVVYGCFVANVLEGAIIDLDHWRHFYLLMALAWGLMLSASAAPVSAVQPAFRPAGPGRARPDRARG
jgi:O-antigen ligase